MRAASSPSVMRSSGADDGHEPGVRRRQAAERAPTISRPTPGPIAAPVAENLLFYGDNLDVLRRHVGSESVDLVYLDPPFNSDRTYNVLFATRDGEAQAQMQAFDDTWTWTAESERLYAEILAGGGKVADAIASFRGFLGE